MTCEEYMKSKKYAQKNNLKLIFIINSYRLNIFFMDV